MPDRLYEPPTNQQLAEAIRRIAYELDVSHVGFEVGFEAAIDQHLSQRDASSEDGDRDG